MPKHAIVIDLFRKYVSVVAFILMGLFILDLASTDRDDLFAMQQTEIQSNISFDGEDFDEDEDEDFLFQIPLETLQNQMDFCPCFTIGARQGESKCPAALRLGQVRRHAPRNGLADSHNYIITRNLQDGADFGSGHLFLSHKSTFFFITKAVSEPSLAAFQSFRLCSLLSQF